MAFRMVRVVGFVLLAGLLSAAQQSVPDAPSATRPPQTASGDVFSGTAPAPPAEQPATTEPAAGQPSASRPATMPGQPPAAPPSSTAESNSREELGTIVVNVTQVIVPVTVKDPSGRLVDGLLRRDFRILENG
ncbi:MAG: hypothetical protein ACRD3I_08360, partial [Terriglobales bacterium]